MKIFIEIWVAVKAAFSVALNTVNFDRALI